MQENPDYHDVVGEVGAFLVEQRAACLAAGIAPEAVAFDPGLGFGKRHEDNLALLKNLATSRRAGLAAAGGGVAQEHHRPGLGRPAAERLAGGLGLAALAVGAGARIVRTHDVAATRDAILMVDAVMDGERQLSDYFGTDGVRGRVGEPPMTVDFALQARERRGAHPGAAKAAACSSARTRACPATCSNRRSRRDSSPPASTCCLIGPLPTPGIAYMTQRLGCNFGVVISRLAQRLRGQRHQVLRRQRQQVVGRSREPDRSGCSTAPW